MGRAGQAVRPYLHTFDYCSFVPYSRGGDAKDNHTLPPDTALRLRWAGTTQAYLTQPNRLNRLFLRKRSRHLPIYSLVKCQPLNWPDPLGCQIRNAHSCATQGPNTNRRSLFCCNASLTLARSSGLSWFEIGTNARKLPRNRWLVVLRTQFIQPIGPGRNRNLQQATKYKQSSQ